MPTLILKIEYDGTNYCGWQLQKHCKSVEGTLDKALMVLTNRKYNIVAAGRTDSGVHAKGQVVSIAFEGDFPLPYDKITKAINSRLPKDVKVKSASVYDGRFNARFDAIDRQYEYHLSTKYYIFERNFVSLIKFPLNIDKLFEAATFFVKDIDFTTYSKFNEDNNNPKCNVSICSWEETAPDKYKLTVKSNHFLYGMVRSLAGAMIDYARGRRDKDYIISSLYAKDRLLNSPLAPPQGLFLSKVFYPEKFDVPILK